VVCDTNILPLIAISPQERRRWQEALQSFATTSTDPRYGHADTYPDEQAVLLDDCLMALQIVFPDGAELEMKFAPGDWRWVKKPS
jgi:hypothetical protein